MILQKVTAAHPAGHPEGYLEAFGNIYRNFALSLMAKMNGEEPTAAMLDYPRVEEGVRGMAFHRCGGGIRKIRKQVD
jgi:hypothetical protein